MPDAPSQDWDLYERACRSEKIAWLRRLTPGQALSLFEEFRTLVSVQPGGSLGLGDLDRRRWEEKLSMRRRVLSALAELDRIRRERSGSNDAD
ncbi:MAG: hypothetical protein JXP34_18655 [Planctomycetes bacterium]|nr:hypothetical protein [Planctomycetota bacterium]